MYNRVLFLIFSFCLTIGFSNSIDAAWSARPKKISLLDEVVTLSCEEHYNRASEFYNSGKWDKAAKEFRLVAFNFPDTSYGQDANFFLGISYYNLKELDLANNAFSQYLQCQTNPRYFKECIDYKFSIAEQFREGAKRRYLSSKQMPKWAAGDDLAIEIYDEVIPAMPSNDIAARALYGKACLLWKQRDYRESIATFHTLINRFPKSELAPECFLLINKVYFEQCQREFQNPDLLAFAEINLQKFEDQFPGEERLEIAQCELLRIKEVYAQGMYETAYFYERIDEPRAAVIYYQKAIADFPETTVAKRCRNRLSAFCPMALQELDNYVPKVSDMGAPEIPDDIDFSGIFEDEERVSA